nr:hypothetical protein GCM10025730_36090 [Promicromonospora thailandica]
MSWAAGMVRVIRRGSRGLAMAMGPDYGVSRTEHPETDVRQCAGLVRNRTRRERASIACMATKWEYATIPLLIHNTKAILDQWGSDGWELVQVVPGPDGTGLVAYLKRPTGGDA